MTRTFFTKIVVLFSILFASCTPDKKEDKLDFQDVFAHMADNIIVPSYDLFYQEIVELETSLNAIDIDAQLGVEAAQDQMLEAYQAWQRVSVYEFGPAAEYSNLLRSNCNTFPTNVDKILENINGEDYNLSSASNYEAKGFPALDYILFSAEEINQLSLTYAIDCVVDMKTRVANVIGDWDAYRAVFIDENGTGQNSSLSLFFNQFLYDYEILKRNKFGLPAGFATQFGIPIAVDASKVEALYSAKSFELIEANLVALYDLFKGLGINGVQGVSIYDKLQENNATSTVVEGDLADAISNQFELCIEGVSSFQNSLYDEIQVNNTQLESVYTDLQKMVPMIKNDMRTYLSVSVTISDSDGD